MMECKKALTEANGDAEKAVTLLRERGLAKAAKREGRASNEGTVAIGSGGDAGAIVEIGCETDFVARTDDSSASRAARRRRDPAGADDVRRSEPRHSTAAGRAAHRGGRRQARRERGVQARRATHGAGGLVGGYVHAGGKLGVLVALRPRRAGRGRGGRQGSLDARRGADPSPVALDRSGVPADLLARERELFAKQAAQTGKPRR